jgi:hypothetical protein
MIFAMDKETKKKWRYEIITPASQGKWRVLDEFDEDKHPLYVDHIRTLIQVQGIWEARIVRQAGRYKEGDSVRVISQYPQQGQIGTIVAFKALETDAVGPVEKYWVEFRDDSSGPHLLDDNDLEFVAPIT